MFFLMIAFLKGVRWHLIVALFAFIWWLVMLSIFLCACWHFCISSLEKMFSSSAHFLIELFGFDAELNRLFIWVEY